MSAVWMSGFENETEDNLIISQIDPEKNSYLVAELEQAEAAASRKLADIRDYLQTLVNIDTRNSEAAIWIAIGYVERVMDE